MPRRVNVNSSRPRRWRLGEVERLAPWAIFGTLSETYRPCGPTGCHGHGAGPQHGPHRQVRYRGEEGQTTGYEVPKAAEGATRPGVAAGQKRQPCWRERAEMNKPGNWRRARVGDSR